LKLRGKAPERLEWARSRMKKFDRRQPDSFSQATSRIGDSTLT
jgi:hypothetical protein